MIIQGIAQILLLYGWDIVFQAENSNSQHTLFNHLAWGINQNLWIIKLDGTNEEMIYNSLLNQACLHPHFTPDGTKLIFSQRIATGQSIPAYANISPGGENPWNGWQMHIADFNINNNVNGINRLTNHRAIGIGTGGFYETNQVSNNKIYYSRTVGGAAYVDDLYSINIDGTNEIQLLTSPSTWDEHGSFSPSGNSYVFISSRINPYWNYPNINATASTVEIELYMIKTSDLPIITTTYNLNPLNKIIQLTNFNKLGDRNKRYLVSDYEWNKLGNSITFQVAPINRINGFIYNPEIWLIQFNQIQ